MRIIRNHPPAYRLLLEAALDEETGRRAETRTAPLVIQVKPESMHGLFREGTIVCVMASDRSRHLRALVDAVESGDRARIVAASHAVANAEEQALMTAPSLEFADVDTIVDVRYAAQFLARRALMYPGAEVVFSTAIWSGGDVDFSRCETIQYSRKADAHKPAEVVVFVSPPHLSEIELAVIRAVPAELSELHIKGPSVSWRDSLQNVYVYDDRVKTVGGADIFDVDDRYKRQHIAGFLVIDDAFRAGQGGFANGQDQQEQAAQQQARQEQAAQQQQQQQAQADANQNQQQQQQQQQAADRQQQQQQQQQAQRNADQQQDRQQQQQQQQQGADRQQQQQQQQQHQDAATRDRQQQQQQQQQRQAQTRQQQQQQQQESGRVLWDLNRQGLDLTPWDRERYLDSLRGQDFSSLDATQSVKALLRIREELLEQGLG